MEKEKEAFKMNTIAMNQFQLHLEESKNVFFSGIYGIGKTTYLKDFFDDPRLSSRYNCFHLFPVNYSIANNEDIFNLLKYDLLFELIKRKEFNRDFSDASGPVTEWKNEKMFDVILRFIECVPKIGKTSKSIIEKLKTTFNEFKEIESREFTGGINDFITEIENRSGSIYENDIITRCINNSLAKLKDGNEKKNVIIIDDLDRIDPEHIFRILNVFSANFDNNEYTVNRFEIDKVIVVADYKNLKSIYKHKYGKGTDFDGYIDKFYSKKVFYLSFSELIISHLNYYTFSMPGRIEEIIKELMNLLFVNEQLNLRKLHRSLEKKGNYNRIIGFSGVKSFFKNIYNDDLEDLINALKKVKLNNTGELEFIQLLFNEFLLEVKLNTITNNPTLLSEYTYNYKFESINRFDYKYDIVRGELIENNKNINNFTTAILWEELIYIFKTF